MNNKDSAGAVAAMSANSNDGENAATAVAMDSDAGASAAVAVSELPSSESSLSLTLIALTISCPVSAAQRVFDIAELVAEILLHLPNVDRAYSEDITFFPDAQLFVLQRVSPTFQATILGNRILRQRMLLQSMPAGSPGPLYDHMAHWLLTEIGVSNEHFRLGGSIASLWARRSSPRKERSQDKRPEASWRKVKLHCVEGGRDTGASLRIIDRTYAHRPYRLLRRFRYEDNTTLGELHDGLQRLIPFIEEYQRALQSSEELVEAQRRRPGRTTEERKKRIEEAWLHEQVTWRKLTDERDRIWGGIDTPKIAS